MKFYDLSVIGKVIHMAEPWPPKIEFSDSEEEAVMLANKLGYRTN